MTQPELTPDMDTRVGNVRAKYSRRWSAIVDERDAMVKIAKRVIDEHYPDEKDVGARRGMYMNFSQMIDAYFQPDLDAAHYLMRILNEELG